MGILENLRKQRAEGRKGFAVLIDPDKPFRMPDLPQPEFLMLGGSLLVNPSPELLIEKIRKEQRLPLVLFPGNSFQLTDSADAILFLSLISGRNPDFLIGQHVIAAPFLKKSGLEIIPTGYMLVDSGRPTTAHYMSASFPLPSDKPDIAAATAMAGEMLGLKLLYLDAGSGAERPVPAALINAVSSSCSIPLIVGGGMRTGRDVKTALESGADLVVIGTAFEKDPESKFLIDLHEIFDRQKHNAPR